MAGVLTQLLDQIDKRKDATAGFTSQEGQDIDIDKLEDGELRRIVQYANAAAAVTSLKVGVIPALPDRKEVEEFLKKRRS